jgi:Acetyltransferase (GNAT) domain
LADFNDKAYESNEVSWWSNWAQTSWLSPNAYVMLSQEFDEYFFNRGGFLDITKGAKKLIVPMESEFEARKLTPHLFLQSGQLDAPLLVTLEKLGYRIVDQMSVMEIDEPYFEVNPGLKIEQVTGDAVKDWTDVYLDAFYGESSQSKAVTGAVQRAAKTGETTLLVGTMDGKPVGVLALHRTDKVCGVYCVGTRRDQRGKHIASTMLDFSHRQAVEEDRRLILQTILSDSVEGLYLKLGFRRAYMKDLFVKDPRRTLK